MTYKDESVFVVVVTATQRGLTCDAKLGYGKGVPLTPEKLKQAVRGARKTLLGFGARRWLPVKVTWRIEDSGASSREDSHDR